MIASSLQIINEGSTINPCSSRPLKILSSFQKVGFLDPAQKLSVDIFRTGQFDEVAVLRRRNMLTSENAMMLNGSIQNKLQIQAILLDLDHREAKLSSKLDGGSDGVYPDGSILLYSSGKTVKGRLQTGRHSSEMFFDRISLAGMRL